MRLKQLPENYFNFDEDFEFESEEMVYEEGDLRVGWSSNYRRSRAEIKNRMTILTIGLTVIKFY